MLSSDKLHFLQELEKGYFSKSTDQLSLKMIQVMNLHRYSPVFLIKPTDNDKTINLRNRSTYSVQLGPRNNLPSGLNYIDWGNIIGFSALPQEILRSMSYVEIPIAVNSYSIVFTWIFGQ